MCLTHSWPQQHILLISSVRRLGQKICSVTKQNSHEAPASVQPRSYFFGRVYKRVIQKSNNFDSALTASGPKLTADNSIHLSLDTCYASNLITIFQGKRFLCQKWLAEKFQSVIIIRFIRFVIKELLSEGKRPQRLMAFSIELSGGYLAVVIVEAHKWP